jgi:hypothetical protein
MKITFRDFRCTNSIHIFIVINCGYDYAANIDIAEKCKLMQPMLACHSREL